MATKHNLDGSLFRLSIFRYLLRPLWQYILMLVLITAVTHGRCRETQIRDNIVSKHKPSRTNKNYRFVWLRQFCRSGLNLNQNKGITQKLSGSMSPGFEMAQIPPQCQLGWFGLSSTSSSRSLTSWTTEKSISRRYSSSSLSTSLSSSSSSSPSLSSTSS